MSDYDEGYRAGMQKMRDAGHARIEELEAKLEAAVEALQWQADQPEAHPFMVAHARATLAKIKEEPKDET